MNKTLKIFIAGAIVIVLAVLIVLQVLENQKLENQLKGKLNSSYNLYDKDGKPALGSDGKTLSVEVLSILDWVRINVVVPTEMQKAQQAQQAQQALEITQ